MVARSDSRRSWRSRRRLGVGALLVLALLALRAGANGRPPFTNGVHFRPGDTRAVYVASTFGLLVSADGCHFDWICEDGIGFGGEFDPAYAITSTGAILATTFHGLRVSRDGGCSFTTATAQLPPSDPGNISNVYLDVAEVGPTGEIWVASSDSAPDNAVYRSTDDAMTFAARGVLSPSMWYRSVKVAPGDANRVYITGYQISGMAPDGGEMPPSAHFFRSGDDGQTWDEQTLVGVVYGSSPQLYAMAVSSANEDVLFVRSDGANPPTGDLLYRSMDGGATFTEVLATTDTITGVVIRDAEGVLVGTQLGGSFESTDGGATFQPLPGAPQLACLDQRSDGIVFGCGANLDPDHMALASSTDGHTWQPVLQLQHIDGIVSCPSGTTEADTCSAEWTSLMTQLSISGPPSCGVVPDGLLDGARSTGTGAHRSGCCDTNGSPGGLVIAVLVGPILVRRRRAACLETSASRASRDAM